jgi:hypothetical protein
VPEKATGHLHTTTKQLEVVMKMYSYFAAFLLAGIILAGTSVSFAQTTTNHPAPDVDGKVWMNSSDSEKKAFLFGAGSALVLEYHIRDKHSEQPSRYVKGWVDALKDMSWTTLANKIDDYYKNNPGKMERPVFDVIWHEVITPNLKK